MIIAFFSCEKKQDDTLEKKAQEYIIHQHNIKLILPKNWIFLSNQGSVDSLSFVNSENIDSGVLQLSISKYKWR